VIDARRDLDGVEWVGQRAFRALSHVFVLRWATAGLGDACLSALGDLAVPDGEWETRTWPTPDKVVTYSLASGPGATGPFRLWRDRLALCTDDRPDVVLDYFLWRLNDDVVQTARDFLFVHSGVVQADTGRLILLPARSGAGKSSLTAALTIAGYRYFSDEFAPVDPVSRQVHPFPKALTLKVGSFPLFPQLRPARAASRDTEHWHVPPEALGSPPATGPAQVALVIMPRYLPGASTQVQRLTRGQVLHELLEHTLNRRVYGGRALTLLTDLVGGCSGYALEYSCLDAAVAAIRDLAQPTRPGSSKAAT
jgi:hypothetical protein